MSSPQDINQTLAQRGERYGEFDDHAKISQGLKSVMANGRRIYALAHDQREALSMIAHKIARIINGDPDYADSWHDIAGYATLVEQRLLKEQSAGEQESEQVDTDCAITGKPFDADAMLDGLTKAQVDELLARMATREFKNLRMEASRKKAWTNLSKNMDAHAGDDLTSDNLSEHLSPTCKVVFIKLDNDASLGATPPKSACASH